jgi:DNA-binding transcriptional ArsR family regulator
MIERLVLSPASITELARPFDMALPSLVQHVSVLEAAGILVSQKVGRVRTCQLSADALVPASDWISRQRTPVEVRLDRLGTYLRSHDNKETEK